MTDSQGAGKPAPSSGIISWICNVDMFKVAGFLGALNTFDILVVSGQIGLTDALPVTWIPHVIAWLKICIGANGIILMGHALTARKWTVPAPLKVLVLFAVLFAALVLAAYPAHAQTPQIVRHLVHHRWAAKKSSRLPFPIPCIGVTNLPLGCTPNTSAAAAPGAPNAVDPVAFLSAFSYDDVQNALNDANSQKPPNTTAAQCWAFLLTIIPAPASAPPPPPTTPAPNPATSLLPTTPGVASAIQKALDDQQLLLSWFSPTGGLAQLNLACAPLVNLLNVQIATGGGLTAAAIAAAANPATTPIIAGIQTLLTGAIAIVK